MSEYKINSGEFLRFQNEDVLEVRAVTRELDEDGVVFHILKLDMLGEVDIVSSLGAQLFCATLMTSLAGRDVMASNIEVSIEEQIVEVTTYSLEN